MSQQTNLLPAELNAALLATSAAAGAALVFMIPFPLPWPIRLALILGLGAGIAWYLTRSTRQALEIAAGSAHHDAMFDPVSKLATPRLAEITLENEMAAARRGRPLTVVLVRVDDLGRYASRHGRGAAETLQRTVALALRRRTRSMHLVAHYLRSQTIFLVILSEVAPPGATTYGKRVRADIAAIRGLPEPITASVGIAAFEPSITSPMELLQRAERALEKASAGGGRIVVAARRPTPTG